MGKQEKEVEEGEEREGKGILNRKAIERARGEKASPQILD